MEIENKTNLNSIIKKKSFNYLPFYISYYSPTVQNKQSPELTEKLHFYLPVSALSYLAGSVSGTIIPDPDPCKSSGSMRIRILNTGYKSQLKTANYLYFFILSKLGQYSRFGSKLIIFGSTTPILSDTGVFF